MVISLLGMHFVSAEISVRADRKMAAAADSAGTRYQPARAAAENIPVELASGPETAPRVITEDQRKTFISEVADAPKHPLQVIIYDQDPEIVAYADQIRVMLVLAGYDSGPKVRTYSPVAVSPTGLFIVVKNPARAPGFTGPLQKALHDIGLNALGAKNEDFGDDEAAVIVGRKIN